MDNSFIITEECDSFFGFNNDIENHLREWREKISLASQYLKEAEKILKDGNPKEACLIQKKASSHAIDAIESLKIVFTIEGEKINEEDLLLTLSRWKSIGENCNYD